MEVKPRKPIPQPIRVADMALFIIKTMDNAKFTYVAFSVYLLLGFVYRGLISHAAIR